MKTSFTPKSLADTTYLVTGGAGFIGSHIVDFLLKHGAKKVRVLDNLSNGDYQNIAHHQENDRFEFIEGDIRDYQTCVHAVKDVQYVTHQAALGSVPRSIEDPITSNATNISGFLNILEASKNESSVKRFVYAASSSTYGDSKELPKREGHEGKPISPYAVTKAVNEMYGDVYSRVYGFHTIGLRYFNIFGPRQSPSNPYAAVIPIFCQAFIDGNQPTINGDGLTSRDFTYVDNAVQANLKALLADELDTHQVYNVACGEQYSLNQMIEQLQAISGEPIKANYGPERTGDVKHSKASIQKIQADLDYQPSVLFEEGLKNVYQWYLSQNSLGHE